MNKYIYFLILLMLSFKVGATALRGVSIGDSCESVHELERAHGSRLKIEGKLKIFEGAHEGFPASISYTCKSGKISVQTINISYSEDSEAKKKVKELEREYTNKYESNPVRDVGEDSAWLVWRSDKSLVIVSALYGGEGSEVYINHGAP